MKKIIYSTITVTILLGLVNCGGGSSSSPSPSPTPTETNQNPEHIVPDLSSSRYTRVSETVTDKQTGLMWQDNSAVKSLKKSWLTDDNYYTCFHDSISPKCLNMSGDTAYTYCKDLTLNGYKDWRIPTTNELMTIVDKDEYPTIEKTFENTQSQFYWSSNSDENIVNYAKGIFFDRGEVGSYNKSDESYIRCVRDR